MLFIKEHVLWQFGNTIFHAFYFVLIVGTTLRIFLSIIIILLAHSASSEVLPDFSDYKTPIYQGKFAEDIQIPGNQFARNFRTRLRETGKCQASCHCF